MIKIKLKISKIKINIKLIAAYSREHKEVGGLTKKGQEGSFGSNKNILYIVWGSGYMVYTFSQTHEMEYFKCFYLFYVKYTSIKLIRNHKVRSKVSDVKFVGFSNREPKRSLCQGQHKHTFSPFQFLKFNLFKLKNNTNSPISPSPHPHKFFL